MNRKTEQKLGRTLAECVDKEVACLIHPRYRGIRAPRTDKTFAKDGCTCHIYWAVVQAKEEITKANQIEQIEELCRKMANNEHDL